MKYLVNNFVVLDILDFVGGNTVAVDDHDSILTHTVSILNLDKGTWRTSYDGQLPAIKPFPI